MRRLVDAREHLDGALVDRPVLEGNLRDLRRVNRVFGGVALSIRAIRALVDSAGHEDTPDPLRVLDVGCGAADIPVALLRAAGPWRTMEVTAVDSRREVIESALALSPALERLPGLTLAVADGRQLPYPDDAFDAAHASLLLHHLEADGAAELLAELRRVARVGVVVNDLARGRLAWLGAWLALRAMTRNAYTLHDGPLSVRRAYTMAEATELLDRAGLRVVHRERGLLGHRWALAAVSR